MAIEFYLDFITPFGYLARARLLEIAAKYGHDVIYRPVDIAQLRANAGNTGPSNSAIPAKLAYFTRDRERWAEYYGMPIVHTLGGFATGVLNRGLYLAIDRVEADRYAEEAWACIWRDGLDPGSPDTEAEMERRMGWSANELAAFARAPETEARYAAEIASASARDVFGVPTFMIGEEMWWGNDRLDFLDRHLASISRTDEAIG